MKFVKPIVAAIVVYFLLDVFLPFDWIVYITFGVVVGCLFGIINLLKDINNKLTPKSNGLIEERENNE
ncbi:hypothetical protein [Cytobacillus sp. IB215316]|uniref:hypothetical protein n=1 Tax=Cytobacillus sp. IB215316 TaxID=3097354 RepID=UPI002A15F83C|nr:hypothetical protein [Cytobacillus sp. IB215316]MDX8360172.1 hypothetical protein [Cytobacillus sp. IB215316]